MILQSLVALYEQLAQEGKLDRPGWAPVKVSWALEIDDEGEIRHLVPLQRAEMRKEKEVLLPQILQVPLPVKRTVGVLPNFLCDNSSYVLGVDQKGKPARSRQCFEAFCELHSALLENCPHPSAQALLAYLRRWSPEAASGHPALRDQLEEVYKGGNIVFLHRGKFIHEIPEIREIWQSSYENRSDSVMGRCLVTGKLAPIQILHPSIKGVVGAQAVGASLVSFNASSLESYGCDGAQGLNAPVSTYAAFAYGSALNYLIANRKHCQRISDTTMVFWSEETQDGYVDAFGDLFGDNNMDDDTLRDAMRAVADGRNANWQGMPLQPDNRFYVLGLAPNAARLSVRFFLCSTFGQLMENLCRHRQDLEIVKFSEDHFNELSLWWLLQETVNQNSRDKSPSPQLAGDMVRAVLQGKPYPKTLFDQVQIRIRAERKVTRGRAAILKAYLLRDASYTHKEVLTVNLNEESTYQPYLLGRLFAVLERLQKEANPSITTTIRDRYFSSACATPALVFPTLTRLAQAHLKKLDERSRDYYDTAIREIIAKMDTGYPTLLMLQDQGVFQIGYYHQRMKKNFNKGEQENV